MARWGEGPFDSDEAADVVDALTKFMKWPGMTPEKAVAHAREMEIVTNPARHDEAEQAIKAWMELPRPVK